MSISEYRPRVCWRICVHSILRVIAAIACGAGLPVFCVHAESIRQVPYEHRIYDAELDCAAHVYTRPSTIHSNCRVLNKSNFDFKSADGIFLAFEVLDKNRKLLKRGKVPLDLIPSGAEKDTTIRVRLDLASNPVCLVLFLTQDWVINFGQKYARRVGPKNGAANNRNSECVFSDDTGRKGSWLVAMERGGKDVLFPYASSGKEIDEDYRWMMDKISSVNDGRFATRVAIADFDNNGLDDIAVGSYGRVENVSASLNLYLRTAEAFEEAVSIGEQKINATVEQMLVADFDNDGLLDLFVPSYEKMYLFMNLDEGEFREVSASSGIQRFDKTYPNPEGAAAVDIDFDGLVDIVLGTRVFMNKGGGGFEETGEKIGLPILFDEGVSVADLDNDGDFDLIVHCLTGLDCPAYLIFRNNNGVFERLSIPALSGYSECTSLGVLSVDLNHDGLLDLVFGTNAVPKKCSQNMIFVQERELAFRHAPHFLQTKAPIINAVKLDGRVCNDVGVILSNAAVELLECDRKAASKAFSAKIILVDARGRRTLHGQSVRIKTPSGKELVRHNEGGGGGYIAQNSYSLILNFPEKGDYQLTTFFSGKNTVTLSKSGIYTIGPKGILSYEMAPE